MALLREAHDLSERVLAAEHDKMIGAIGRVYLAASRELLAGTISELELERPTNGIRLARHLFEFELEFFYIADRPAVRMQQFFAESAQRGLNIEDRVAGVTLPATAKRQMKAHVANARKAAAERAELASIAGNKDIPEPWGMPSRRVMQEIAESREPNRKENYDLFYAHSSSLSHPGPLGVATYAANKGGALHVRTEGSDLVRAGQACSLAAFSFVNLMDSVNWVNDARLGADIRELAGRFEKLVPRGRRKVTR